MRPLKDKILIERIPAEKVSPGGIVLHRTDAPDKAKILAVGPEVDDVSIGEIALVNWNAAVKTEGEQYVIAEEHIVFVYEE